METCWSPLSVEGKTTLYGPNECTAGNMRQNFQHSVCFPKISNIVCAFQGVKLSGWQFTTLASMSAGLPTAPPLTYPSLSWKVVFLRLQQISCQLLLLHLISIFRFFWISQENFMLQCSRMHLAIPSSSLIHSSPLSSCSLPISFFLPGLLPFSPP